MAGVELVHNFADTLLRLPRLAAPVIKVKHMLYRLVTVSIVTHIHNLHLTYLVNCKAVIAVVKMRRYVKHLVQICIECIIPSHKCDKSCRIVEY